MSQTRITLTLDPNELSALIRLAKLELRHPREQARLIIRNEMGKRGLIAEENESKQDGPMREVPNDN